MGRLASGAATLVFCLLVAVAAVPRGAAADLADGMTIGAATAAQVRDLLPAEIYEHYAKGEYQNRYFDVDKPGMLSPLPSPPFREASQANRGRYVLAADGSIASADGSTPGFITGFPFPDIDPKDPQAGQKIGWNYFYGWWYNGNGHFYNEVRWINREGVERAVLTDTQFLFYQSSPQARDMKNSEDLLIRQRSQVLEPVDLQGTTTVSWRFRSGRQRDQNWVYVPALRRVRAVSPANRSDGFLGSDLSQDDGRYFDGKPEDFEWKLVGEQEMLGLTEEAAYRGEGRMAPVPGGGWRILWNADPWVGFEEPGWKGVAWAPVDFQLMKRSFWVVEVRPKDAYYLYGKILLRFTKDSFDGYWSSKYDWKGDLLMSYQTSNGVWNTPDQGKSWISYGVSVFQTAENLKLDRATGVSFKRGGASPSDYRVPLQASDFDPDALIRAGK